ncbi:hypothetical protein [Devosia sp.]|uniref:hypothetical protein n=1 Tax=Devosia sp. TaxID=1871048 RepID=UPI0032644489
MTATHNGLPVIASFWHGPLSWLERLCIDSFVKQGHAFHLYSYEPISGLPPGAEWRDAATILPQDKLVFYKGRGTAGVFSDYFRMSLLQREKGIWADADVYCVKPFVDPPEFFVGFERQGSINGAVLLIPSDAPLLADLISVFTEAKRPLFEPHLPLCRRLEVAGKRLLGQKVAPEYMQYGATGPFALTHYVARRGLWDQVQPVDVFYPVPYEGIPALMQAGSDLSAITERTLAVHIWRSQLTNRGRAGMGVPEAGSALADLCAKHGIDPQ